MHTFAQKPKATQKTASAKSTIPGRGHLGQSPEVRSILHLQGAIGNQAVQRMLQTDGGQPEAELTGPASPHFGHDFSRIPIHPPAAGAMQTKLAINKQGDSYEQEADNVAEQVMRTPEPQLQRACPCGGGCPKCRTEQPGREHESLQTKRVQASDTGQIAAPPIVHEVLRSPGQPLDPATRAFMEPRFGYDFSRVRVHCDSAAEQSARDVNAHAYTIGHNIVFGASRFVPGAHNGRRLLAHELCHVVQQGGGSSRRGTSLPSLSAAPGGYAQRQPQLPRFSESTEHQIAALMDEHPRLSRVNAERAVLGPEGAVPQASGKGGTKVTGTGKGNLPKVADIEFHRPSTRGRSVLLGREVKTWEGAQGRFDAAVSDAADQLQARGGGQLLIQVPEGTNARSRVQRFKGAVIKSPEGVQKYGRYRSISITIVNPSGTVLLDEPLEFPMSKVKPAGGAGPGPGTKGGGVGSSLEKGGQTPTTPESTRTPAGTGTVATSTMTGGGGAGVTAKGASSPVTARDVAAELNHIEATSRSMAKAAKFMRWGLGVWHALNVLTDAFKAFNLSVAALAHGNPFWKEIAQAREWERKGRELQDYYNVLEVLKGMPGAKDVEWDSQYQLTQFQLNFMFIENHLNDALEEIKEIRAGLQSQSDDLGDAMARYIAAAVVFPTTSLVYGEMIFFADAAGQMRRSLEKADASYLDAQQSIERQRRFLNAAVVQLIWRQGVLEGSLRASRLNGP